MNCNEDLLERLNNEIIVVDEFFNIVYINKKFENSTGYKRSDIVSQNLFESLLRECDAKEKIMSCIDDSALELFTEIYSPFEEKVTMKFYIVKEVYNDNKIYILICNSIKEKNENKLLNQIKELLNEIPYYVWINDDEGRFVYSNAAFSILLGKLPSEIRGQAYDEIFSYETAIKIMNSDKKVMENRRSDFVQIEMEVKGKKLCFEQYKMPMFDENNNVIGIMAVGRDISVWNALNREIDRSKDQLSALYKIFDTEDISRDISKIFDGMGEIILDEFKGDAAWILLTDKNEEQLFLEASYKLNEKQIKGLKNINKLITNVNGKLKDKVLPNVRYVDNIFSNSNFDYSFMGTITSVASYPIHFGNKLLGVLCIGYKKNKNIIYRSGIFIESICNQLAMVIKNKSLFDDAKRELSKRVRVEEELRLFFNTAKELMSIIKSDGTFIKFNNEWLNLGWDKETVIDKGAFGLIHQDEREKVKFLLSMKKEITEVVAKQLCKDGSCRWISWKFKYVKERDVFVSTGRDITEDIKMKEKNEILEKTIQMETVRSEFFANISHEFKTPLNIILATMQLINQNIEVNKITAVEGVNLEKYIDAISKNSYRLLRLVNNLIDMTKIDSGFYNIKKGNYNIISVVEDVTQSAAEYITSNGIKLTFDTDVEEQIIACDPDKIERIMLNLLSNAVKYSSENGKILVDIKINNGYVCIAVCDNGIGISEDQKEFIFERFGQVDSLLSRRVEGSGIGLSLVKSLVEMHDGEVCVKSKLGQGSKFIIRLPILLMDNNESIYREYNMAENLIRKGKIEFSDI